MTISQELANFRIDNSTNTTQLPDSVWLRYYNDWRDILIDKIISKKEDFFYNEITTWITQLQREYALPKRWDLDWNWNPIWWIIKIKSLSRKYKADDTYYTKIDNKILENLPYDLWDYENYENTAEEFYVLSDNSVFLYPVPTETITDWLKMYWIVYPLELGLNDEETIFSQYKKVILLYVSKRYFESQRLFNEAQIFENKFNIEVERIANTISGRVQSPKPITTPNLQNYC